MENLFTFNAVWLVYVLKLEDECYYVGVTSNLNVRLGQHLEGSGAIWTRMHRIVGIEEVRFGNRQTEDQITKEYIKKYGGDKVKGGSWTKVSKKIAIEYWLKQISI